MIAYCVEIFFVRILFISIFLILCRDAPSGSSQGGFNNIRMSLENIIVFAAATGRTLVLPPPEQIYLLSGVRSLADFFPFLSESFKRRVDVITSKQFLAMETERGGYLEIENKTMREALFKISEECELNNGKSRSLSFSGLVISLRTLRGSNNDAPTDEYSIFPS